MSISAHFPPHVSAALVLASQVDQPLKSSAARKAAIDAATLAARRDFPEYFRHSALGARNNPAAYSLGERDEDVS